MKLFKEIMKRIFISIAMSFIIFIVIGIIFDIKDGGKFTLTDYGFTNHQLTDTACPRQTLYSH